jgi:hypothetical protein
MANSTFSGPVRSENGFLEKDEAGNWVPVSGGGGGGGPAEALAVPLRFPTATFDSTPALPIINIFGQNLYEYDGTVSSTVTAITGASAAPGTYSNPVVSIGYTNGFITAAAEGVAPSPGPSTAPVVGYASVSTVLNAYNGTVTLAADGLPSGAMVVGVYVQSNTGINGGDNYVDFTFSTNTNDIVSTYLPYYYPSGAQYSLFSNPSEWYSPISPLGSGGDGPLVVTWNAGGFLTDVPYQFTVQYVVFP